MATIDSEMNLEPSIREAFQTCRWLLMAQGIIMVILGCLAVAYPVVSTVAVDIYLGWLFLFSGIVGVVAMFSARTVPAFLWTLITALLAIAAGVFLIGKPIEGAASLTLVLTAFFIAEGALQIMASISYRDAFPGSRGWMLASGLADLLLAAITHGRTNARGQVHE